MLWAVGGGKGGTGKSFILSNLATTLAGRGRKVIVVDADLGGANLHSFFGVPRPRTSLTDFFEKRVPLEDLVVRCDTNERLGLVVGNLHSMESDLIHYGQKLKLFRHLQALDADFILLDLGAGTHPNAMDLFLKADRKIVVTIPEITSIENLYLFIKNVVYRSMKNVFGRVGCRQALTDAWRTHEEKGLRTLKDLIEYLKGTSPVVENAVREALEPIDFHVVLNQVRNVEESRVGFSICSVSSRVIGVDARFSGYVPYDYSVHEAINKRELFSGGRLPRSYAHRIEQIADNIENLGEFRYSQE